MTERRIPGLVLAGGQSRRMGGGDKALIEIAGRPMLARVIDRFGPQVGPLAINANGDPARFATFGLPVVADTAPGFAGPLAGVLAGMRWSASVAPDATHLATVSADAPFLPADLVARLASATGTGEHVIALAGSGGTTHPVIGLWPIGLADDLEHALAAGIRKVQSWADRRDAIVIDFPALEVGGIRLDPFFNTNTPEDLEQARAFIEAAEKS